MSMSISSCNTKSDSHNYNIIMSICIFNVRDSIIIYYVLGYRSSDADVRGLYM